VPFLLLSFGVFAALRLLDEFITVPTWFFILLAVGLGVGGVLIAGEPWWTGPGVAGLAFAWRAVEELLTAWRDWLRMQVLRGPTRR
jgi:hypothetical protein